jgi:hypothetical protein
MKKKELTAADVWAMFAETSRLFKEELEKERKWREKSEETMFAETSRLFKEELEKERKWHEKSEENERKWSEERKEFDRKFYAMCKEIGGISNSNGDFAEEFFYNSLKETMTFAGTHFEYISNKFARQRTMPDKTEVRAQFDIVLHNGDSIALIEAKYKADLEDIKELVEKTVMNFRFLYPEFANYKLYLGIGSLVLKDRIVQEAKKLGIGLMRQKGDAVEYKTDWVRAY